MSFEDHVNKIAMTIGLICCAAISIKSLWKTFKDL
jgi:hypothetical protein